VIKKQPEGPARATAHQLLEFGQAAQADFVHQLRLLVETESPSHHKAGVDAASHMVSIWLAALGARITMHSQRAHGDILQAEFPGRNKRPRLLLLGHLDTVYELGTLARMPWREHDGYIHGPGIFDMKFGVVQMFFALRALLQIEGSLPGPVTVLLNPDEEIGSPVSRPVTEKLAARHDAVLVFEPSAGPDGACKTSRKGVGHYLLRVEGKAAHAGLDFELGASAILELAQQLPRVAALTDLNRGITVNPGVIRGGTRTNVIAESAEAEIDVRVVSAAQARTLERSLTALRPADPRCTLHISGGMNRMPFERTANTLKLYRKARKLAAEIGLDLPEIGVGGGSDGNITANLGIPTLDGLGAVGEGAHAPDERILEREIPRRIALAASLIGNIV
jgi:glutamate carboxypeptidase